VQRRSALFAMVQMIATDRPAQSNSNLSLIGLMTSARTRRSSNTLSDLAKAAQMIVACRGHFHYVLFHGQLVDKMKAEVADSS